MRGNDGSLPNPYTVGQTQPSLMVSLVDVDGVTLESRVLEQAIDASCQRTRGLDIVRFSGARALVLLYPTPD